MGKLRVAFGIDSMLMDDGIRKDNSGIGFRIFIQHAETKLSGVEHNYIFVKQV
jgi:hypothetical protein